MATLEIATIKTIAIGTPAGDELWPINQNGKTAKATAAVVKALLAIGISDVSGLTAAIDELTLDATREVDANYTITAADATRLIVATVAAIAGTLPATTALPPGAAIRIYNDSGGQAYVDPPGGVSINGGTAGDGVTLEHRDGVTIYVRDSANYDLIWGAS